MSSKAILYGAFIVILISLFNAHNCRAQNTRRNSNRISRLRGNILQNLTRTHAYEDNIVTSQLDASIRVRQFYRDIRNIYNK